MQAAGLTTGFGDGTFRPAAWLSRGQMASLLARAAGLDLDAVPADAVDPAEGAHARAVAALEAIGIVECFEDGTFGADQPIRRDQLASMLSRLLEHQDQTSNSQGAPPARASSPAIRPGPLPISTPLPHQSRAQVRPAPRSSRNSPLR